MLTPARSLSLSFYSLSCETYSGTAAAVLTMALGALFLFAVVRDVQRNTKNILNVYYGFMRFLFAVVRDVQRNGRHGWRLSFVARRFLFAVVRDVQRNRTADRRVGQGSRFYSRSCE